MEPKVPGLLAFALCATFAPLAARAGEAPFQVRFSEGAGPAEQAASFDVRHVGWLKTSTGVTDGLNSEALADDEEAYRRRKVKIRWIYQPLDGGPQFEIGTYGSRKGAMKKKLIHVALDWNF